MNSRVIGGNDAGIGRYPYMASIQFTDSPYELPFDIFLKYYYVFTGEYPRDKFYEYFDTNEFHFCGGSLISSRAVLTSADCADRVNSFESQVVIGCDDISDQVNCIVASVQEVVLHPNFLLDRNNFGNDIGIIILDEVVSNPTIPLASPSITIKNGEVLRHIGYGATFDLDTPPRAQLQEIELGVVEKQICLDKLEDVFNVDISNAYDFNYALREGKLEDVICAVGDGESGCKTDSGGPFLYPCDTEGVGDILLGLSSFTFNCGGDGIPIPVESVFSETAFEFIQTVIQNFTLDDVQIVETTDEFCPEFPIDPVIPPTPFPTFVASDWQCDDFYFASKDGCDCECGIPDPDCETPSQPVFGCRRGQKCFEGTCVEAPTANPTVLPTLNPTVNPTTSPTLNPSLKPTASPSLNPSVTPTTSPTSNPTIIPTSNPTYSPTIQSAPPSSSTPVIILVIGLIVLLSIALVFFLRQRSKNQDSRKIVNEQENKNLMIMTPNQKHLKVSSPAGYQALAQDSIFSPLEIPGLQMGESEGVGGQSTFHTVPKKLTDRDRANHMKVRGAISRHSKYAQVINMMLEFNDLPKLKGETRTKLFIDGVTSLLSKALVENGDQVDDQLSEFDSAQEPDISLSVHLLRLIEGVNFWYEPTNVWNSTVGINSMLLALHLLRRMKYLLEFKTTVLNIHKTCSVLVLLSTKFIVDRPFSNTYWAAIAGIEADELSKLEDVLCFLVGFDFSIDEVELLKSLRPYESFGTIGISSS